MSTNNVRARPRTEGVDDILTHDNPTPPARPTPNPRAAISHDLRERILKRLPAAGKVPRPDSNAEGRRRVTPPASTSGPRGEAALRHYGSRPTKRRRRTQADISEIKRRIIETLREGQPMTVRQLFYQLVSSGTIPKTEAEYKGTVVRLTGEMRLASEIPFAWIADNTRWMRKPETYSGLEQALRRTVLTYRRSVWDSQAAYVEVWLEKDALAGVLIDVTSAWDVPLMVTRGFASLSFLHSAADAIEAQGKPAFLYYLGDHDPSGLEIPRTIEARLRRFAPKAVIHFERVAVTPEQIKSMYLPTRPTKKTDSRSKHFAGESVEVDAIEASILRRLVEECITKHIDSDAHEALKMIEDAERKTLTKIVIDGLYNADDEEPEIEGDDDRYSDEG